MKTKFYSIRSHPTNPNLCPLCNTLLKSCHVGVFCSKEECPYVDGAAWLTPKQVKKFKDLILK